MANKQISMGIALAIFVVMTMALFPTVLCLCRCAGCNWACETDAGTTDEFGQYLMTLDHPICPGQWNGTNTEGNITLTDCNCCNDTAPSYWKEYWGDPEEQTTGWWMYNGTGICNLPNTVIFNTGVPATAYNFTLCYCRLEITCTLWDMIQLVPLFYIIGTFVTVALFAIITVDTGRGRIE